MLKEPSGFEILTYFRAKPLGSNLANNISVEIMNFFNCQSNFSQFDRSEFMDILVEVIFEKSTLKK